MTSDCRRSLPPRDRCSRVRDRRSRARPEAFRADDTGAGEYSPPTAAIVSYGRTQRQSTPAKRGVTLEPRGPAVVFRSLGCRLQATRHIPKVTDASVCSAARSAGHPRRLALLSLDSEVGLPRPGLALLAFAPNRACALLRAECPAGHRDRCFAPCRSVSSLAPYEEPTRFGGPAGFRQTRAFLANPRLLADPPLFADQHLPR